MIPLEVLFERYIDGKISLEDAYAQRPDVNRSYLQSFFEGSKREREARAKYDQGHYSSLGAFASDLLGLDRIDALRQLRQAAPVEVSSTGRYRHLRDRRRAELSAARFQSHQTMASQYRNLKNPQYRSAPRTAAAPYNSRASLNPSGGRGPPTSTFDPKEPMVIHLTLKGPDWSEEARQKVLEAAKLPLPQLLELVYVQYGDLLKLKKEITKLEDQLISCANKNEDLILEIAGLQQELKQCESKVSDRTLGGPYLARGQKRSRFLP